jgi:uncharacterized membrane protein
MEENKEKIKRLQIWAVFFIIIGAIASYLLPEHATSDFFGLLKDIITNLIL